MGDNVDIRDASGTVESIKSDSTPTGKVQFVKLTDGEDGSDTPVGTQENPLIVSLKDFKISDIDSDNGYYGYLKFTGEWYILKLTDTTARYAFGLSAYSASWSDKEHLTYQLLNEAFI
jgi:hypothetical protein